MGAYVLTVPPSGGCSNTSTNTLEPLMFQKEISSDGSVNTVDAMYPAMPFFLYLEPLFHNQEGGFYPNELLHARSWDEFPECYWARGG